MSDALDSALIQMRESLEQLVSDRRADAIRAIARGLYSEDVPHEISAKSELASFEELLQLLDRRNPTLAQMRDSNFRMGHLATLVTAYLMYLQNDRIVPLLQSGAKAQHAAVKAQAKNMETLPARDAALLIAVQEARKLHPGMSWTKLTDIIVAKTFRFADPGDSKSKIGLSGKQIRRRMDRCIEQNPDMSWIRQRRENAPKI